MKTLVKFIKLRKIGDNNVSKAGEHSYNILLEGGEFEEYDKNHIPYTVHNQINTNVLPVATILDKKTIQTLFDDFEDEYIIIFILHSLGYNDEDIATQIPLPACSIKSKVFYFKQKMRVMLQDV